MLHVYCPSSAAPFDEACSGGGSALAGDPLRTLGAAADLATELGITTVRVASRGGDDAYEESRTVAAPLLISGGYSPDFAARDPAANPTRITSSRPTTLSLAPSADGTTLSGLTISNGGVGARTAALLLDGLSGATTVEDCRIAGSSAGQNSDALLISGSARATPVILRRSEIAAGDTTLAGATTCGLRVAGNAVAGSDGTLRGGMRPNTSGTHTSAVCVERGGLSLSDVAVTGSESSVFVQSGGSAAIVGASVAVPEGLTAVDVSGGSFTMSDGSIIGRMSFTEESNGSLDRVQ